MTIRYIPIAKWCNMHYDLLHRVLNASLGITRDLYKLSVWMNHDNRVVIEVSIDLPSFGVGIELTIQTLDILILGNNIKEK